MDFTALRSLFASPSIVVWFALLVSGFAVFVGLGLYVTRREARLKAAEASEEAKRSKLPVPRRAARRPGSLSRSRRELKHSQETS